MPKPHRFWRRVLVATSAVAASLVISVASVGATLTFVNRTTADGLGVNPVRALFVDGQNVYVATSSGGVGGLSISTDGGQSFITRTTSDGLGSNTIDGIWASGSTVYVATGAGLSVSTDGGATFTNDNLGGGNNAAVKSVHRSGQNLYVATVAGLNVSSDAGQTFTLRNSSAFGGTQQEAFVTDVDGSGSTVYAAIYYLDAFSSSGRIFKSVDNGATFTATGASAGNWINVFVDGSNVYATDSSNALFVSTDAGATFTQWVTPGFAVSNVWASGSTVYLATDAGLKLTTDGGSTFSTYTQSDGLGASTIYGGVASNGSSVFAGTSGGLSIGSQPTPTVTAVNPSSGPAAGGTSITITGTNFANGATVTIGGATCTNVTVVSATEITCTTPAGTAGTSSVVVTSSGQSNVANTLFTYNAPPAPAPIFVAPPATQPPATQPPASQPPSEPGTPSLVNSGNQQTLTQAPGGATAIVNGQPVAVEVQAPADLPAANVAPENRTPEQVQQLQEAANEIVDRLADAAGGNPAVSVVPTPTGAVITGLLDENVPVEDVVLVETPETATLFAALNGDGSVTEVNPGGVIQVLGDGTIGVLAYGLTPGENVELVIMSDPQLLGSFEVNEQGEVKVQAGLPDGLGAGDHTLVVASPTIQASLGLQVAERPLTLPVTGGDTDTLAPVLVVLSLGAILVVIARRRLVLVP